MTKGSDQIQQLKANEYQCEKCKGIFETGWTDEEAREEAKQWGDMPKEDMAIICDDCYKQLMNHLDKNTILI